MPRKPSEFTIRRVTHRNCKKFGSKLELSLVSAAVHAPEHAPSPNSDHQKKVMIRSMKEAAEAFGAIRELGFRAEDATTVGLGIRILNTCQF